MYRQNRKTKMNKQEESLKIVDRHKNYMHKQHYCKSCKDKGETSVLWV